MYLSPSSLRAQVNWYALDYTTYHDIVVALDEQGALTEIHRSLFKPVLAKTGKTAKGGKFSL